ncbi:Protein FMP52, mitochondrial [Candida viswanathii]|uniref:Protein FMP52, mitochondrial n=1 Tax=Candida viswanathii TaxID=5486 RepID=A0A367YEH6_9ASCO|nr:Protein FMP52, mitochondrial [Candida viswanathii]
MSTFILGSTGLVGAQIVKYAESSPVISSILTITRRTPSFAESSKKVTTLEDTNTDKWPEIIKSNKPTDAFISAFGTTRAKAGSAEKFKTIDYGVNFSNAKAAKENGTKVYVLVSSIGANANSNFLYMKTKGELEDDVIALGFDHTIILRPGILLGQREGAHGFGNDFAATIGGWAKHTFLQRWMHSIEASDVGKVAVDFAAKGIKGELKEKVTIVEGGDLIKLANDLQ